MIERWGIIFGDLLVILGVVALAGLVELGFWPALVVTIMGSVGVVIGLSGDELRARTYFQVLAGLASLGLVMALGAALSGAHFLFGVPLTAGSFSLFIIVMAATFFAGFEPEAIEDATLVVQRS